MTSSMIYKPQPVPEGIPGGDYLRRELAALQRALVAAQPRLPMQYLAVKPDRPLNGLYCFAAGVVSGAAARGLYRYDEATAAYTFLG